MSLLRANEEQRLLLTVFKLLCKSKVDQLEVPISINEHVFGFHVSVGNALALMKEFKNEDHLGHIKSGSIFVKARCSPQICEYFATWAIIQLFLVSRNVTLKAKVCEQAYRGNPYLKSL